jgi:hypothetical protein
MEEGQSDAVRGLNQQLLALKLEEERPELRMQEASKRWYPSSIYHLIQQYHSWGYTQKTVTPEAPAHPCLLRHYAQ